MRQQSSLIERLRDERSGSVVFLSHCLLNQSTRYLGGACRPGCVREIVEQCVDEGIGMVQMPCPEERAWGGVRKRFMLALYGTGAPTVLLRAAASYTRARYRQLARRVARQIEDYLSCGFSVIGVVGVDGSPSCGLRQTVDLVRCGRALAGLDPRAVSVEVQNRTVRANVVDGSGIFIDELRAELERRGLRVPLLAHDLLGELDGARSSVRLTRTTA